jgi:hypothetical protein
MTADNEILGTIYDAMRSRVKKAELMDEKPLMLVFIDKQNLIQMWFPSQISKEQLRDLLENLIKNLQD